MNTYGNLSQLRDVAALIDHTLLKPEACRNDIVQLCTQARAHHFAAVCVNPYWVPLAAEELSGSRTRVATVIGFPLGANRIDTKLREAERAISEGAVELDMVQNIGALRSGDTHFVQQEIEQIAAIAHGAGALLKVILETALLTEEEKRQACSLALAAHADFVKTSTGFSTGGATAADVRLMRAAVGTQAGVKASGGIRTLASLREMVSAGANRIGTSSGVTILEEFTREAASQKRTSPEPHAVAGNTQGY